MSSNSGTQKNNNQDTIDLLRRVRQVRQFVPGHVPDEAVNNILEVARWTGSAMNRQPWDLVLVRDRATIQKIVEEEGKGSHLAGADFAVVVVMPGQNQALETYDEGRLAERMLIAAKAEGLGAGIWWFKDGGAAAKRILGIPEDRLVRTAISFGYPDKEAMAAASKGGEARRPMSDVVHREKF